MPDLKHTYDYPDEVGILISKANKGDRTAMKELLDKELLHPDDKKRIKYSKKLSWKKGAGTARLNVLFEYLKLQRTLYSILNCMQYNTKSINILKRKLNKFSRKIKRGYLNGNYWSDYKFSINYYRIHNLVKNYRAYMSRY